MLRIKLAIVTLLVMIANITLTMLRQILVVASVQTFLKKHLMIMFTVASIVHSIVSALLNKQCYEKC